MAWSGEHRAFVIEEFVKNGESVVATQHSFQRHFSLNRHDPVPTGKTIHRWVSNFRQTSSALNRRRSGRPRTRTAQENATAVANSIEQFPRRSIRKHAFALHISATSVHRILHRSLHMHPVLLLLKVVLNLAVHTSNCVFPRIPKPEVIQNSITNHVIIDQ